MHARTYLFSVTLLFGCLLSAQDSLSLLFIGDVMQHSPQITSAYNTTTKTYEYDHCFKYLKEEMSAADITIANLEFTLAGSPYTGYPMFSAPDETAVALKNAGVDILVTANNHTCDRRKKGIIRTLDVLDSLEISHTGSFRNQAEKEFTYPMLIEKNGFRLALLNYTYGTNGMPIDPPTVVNLIKEADIKADVKKAKEMGVDKIIAVMHWGAEYTHVPNAEQKLAAKWLFENGADIIIGSHPHVIQPMYRHTSDTSDQLIVYSLGNFISNQRTAPRDGGAMVKINLVKENGQVRIAEAGYQLTWVWLPLEGGKRRYYVMPAAKYEADRKMMDAASHTLMKTYIKSSRVLLDAKNKDVREYRFSAESGWDLQ